MDLPPNQNSNDESQLRRQPEGLPVSHDSTFPQASPAQGSGGIPGMNGNAAMPPVLPHTPVPPSSDEERGGMPGIIKVILGIGAFLLVSFLVFSFIMSKMGTSGGGKKVTLTYWGLWEDEPVMQSVIADFERVNPNITVSYVKQDPKQYSERLLARIQNGSGPDIFRFHTSWMPMIIPALLPLPQETITKQEFVKNYYEVTQSDLIKNGAIYAIPLEIDTLSLFTNTDLLQKENVKVPTNWTDFIAASKSLTIKDAKSKIKTAGAALGSYDNVTHASDIISLLLVQNGANINNLSQTAKNASDALAFYASFVTTDANVWDTTLDPSLTMFASGKLGMYFGYSWDIFALKAMNPSLNFTVNPVPHLPGRNMTIASYWAEGVSNKSTHQKEAALFMKFLAQKTTLQKLYTEESKKRLFGELYPQKDLADSLKDNALIYPFVQQSGSAMSSLFAGETQDTGISAQMNHYLSNAVSDVLQNTSPQTAVDTLSKGVDQVLQQYAPSKKSNP